MTTPGHTNVLRTNQTCPPLPRFCSNLSQYAVIVPNHWSMQIFFTSGISPDILMNVVEDCIIFVIWAVWAIFKFYLKQKVFSMAIYWKRLLISFHGGIRSRYSEINNFKISKDLSFQKKKKIKNALFKGIFKYRKDNCSTRYLL